MCTSASSMMNLRKTCKTCRNRKLPEIERTNNPRTRNLQNDRGDYYNTELTIIFCVIYFSFLFCKFDLDASKSSKAYQRFSAAGAGSY